MNQHSRSRIAKLPATGTCNGLTMTAVSRWPSSPAEGARTGDHVRGAVLWRLRGSPHRPGLAEERRTKTERKCEGATGSLAIVASDHGPSHPCGVTTDRDCQRYPEGSRKSECLYPVNLRSVTLLRWHLFLQRSVRGKQYRLGSFELPTLPRHRNRCCLPA